MAFHTIQDPERLHALIDAILLIEVDADLSDLLRTIVEEACHLVGARYGALGVIAGDARTLSRFITYGVDDMVRREIGPDPHGHGVLGETIRRAEPLRIDDLAAYRTFEGFPENHPHMTRFLGVPVRTADGQVFGNLYLCDRLDDLAFSEDDEALVDGFGRAAGLVIDQVNLRAQLRDLTLNEERERLAQDLHDTVIQRLFGVGLSLQMALASTVPASAHDAIDVALDELDTTIHEIRTTIFEIDREDEGAGLASRAEALALEVGARLRTPVELHVASDVADLVGPRSAHQALVALREMLSNVVRHADATHAKVDVEIQANLVVVSVTDDGVGFVARVGPGRGLRNLTSRARELGGDCTIDSAPGRGTLVRWTANRLA